MLFRVEMVEIVARTMLAQPIYLKALLDSFDHHLLERPYRMLAELP